ncbi:MAG: hypothetical protein QMD21_02045 [Candidatus Thermoplasmatota archaeon]|nr:hypothetical protein [Candidatus Thermoplasmatota archaeon]MDI6855552.1 hypothetical protein [Candidatus Thermoplasmatota archaeon]
MVCYTVPTGAAIVHYVLRKSISGWKKSNYLYWLNILLLGGAIFGIVDHLWNGELFLISEEPMMDILLGVTITISIFVVWALIVAIDKARAPKPAKFPA